MKFDNETSIIQQKIANGYAGVSRRLALSLIHISEPTRLR